MNEKELLPFLLVPDQQKALHAFGDEVRFLLTGKETAGKYTMFLSSTGPGGGPPPHIHNCEDEWFYVLEGRVSFCKNGEWSEVPVGTTVFLPKGYPHTYKNVGDTPLRMLVHTAPSGFETFFSRCAEECAATGGPNMDKIMQICGEHGIQFV